MTTRYAFFVEQLQEWAAQEGYKIHDQYSGRHMYGKTCIGVVVPNYNAIADFFFFYGYIAARCEEAHVEYPPLHIDDMGHGLIIYWPGASKE